jgi:hypothetical protein
MTMGKPQGTTPESSQLITMAKMIVDLEDKHTELHQQLLETQHELAIRMDILHEYPWCCVEARSSNGWHHNINCVNWRLCY